MSKRTKYSDGPVGKIKAIDDFLPSPEDLVFRDETVKVTILLSKRSLQFFKREAARRRTQYQRMIQRLLEAYAEHHEGHLAPRPRRGGSK